MKLKKFKSKIPKTKISSTQLKSAIKVHHIGLAKSENYKKLMKDKIKLDRGALKRSKKEAKFAKNIKAY